MGTFKGHISQNLLSWIFSWFICTPVKASRMSISCLIITRSKTYSEKLKVLIKYKMFDYFCTIGSSYPLGTIDQTIILKYFVFYAFVPFFSSINSLILSVPLHLLPLLLTLIVCSIFRGVQRGGRKIVFNICLLYLMDALPPISCYSLYGPMWQGIWETFYLVIQEGKPAGCLKKGWSRSVCANMCNMVIYRMSQNVWPTYVGHISRDIFRTYILLGLLHRCRLGINGKWLVKTQFFRTPFTCQNKWLEVR